MHCCGVYGPHDYIITGNTEEILPEVCCPHISTSETGCIVDFAKSRGCGRILHEEFLKGFTILFAADAVVTVLHVSQ